MKFIKKFNENIDNDIYVKDILGNSEYNNITNKGVGLLIDDNYSYDELKEYYINEIISFKSKIGKYTSRIFTIFEHGNVNGRMDIEIVFLDDKPLFAVLLEAESEIIDNSLYVNEDDKEQIEINLTDYL